MRVLVTGGAGYIGAIVARALHDEGHDVVVIDRRGAGHLTALLDVEAVQGDLGDRGVVAGLFRHGRFDAVVHLAADKSVEASLRDPGGYFRNNIGATLVLLEAMTTAGVECFVFSSTCAVYAATDEPPFTEASAVGPKSPYGVSKLLVETTLPWFERANGLRSVSLRYFNAAGAADDGRLGEDWSDAVNLIPVAMRVAAGHERELVVHGHDYPTPDGTALRDYVHVLDLAAAHVAALTYLADGGPGTMLNIGTGRAASVLDVVSAVERASGRDVPTVLGPRRAGDLAAVWADSSRAEHVLGWRAARTLDDIARSAWRWHAGVSAATTPPR
jgi:UDP-glucose-4-epimerase GalE